MSKMNESKALNEALESAPIDQDVMARLEELKNLGIDSDLFDMFHEKIMGIVNQNPLASKVVESQLAKTKISLSQLVQKYHTERTAVYWTATETDIEMNRNYRGKPANDEFYSDDAQAA